MYKNIVVPVDICDEESLRSVISAVVNISMMSSANVHFINIIPDFGMRLIEDYLPRHWFQDQTKKYEAQMKDLVNKYIPHDINSKFYVGRGTIYDEVINYADNNEADLIIISAVRQQLSDYMLGSNASKIVRHSTTSVLVVRN